MPGTLLIAVILAGFGVCSVPPAVAAVNKCDVAWSKCNLNAGKCQTQDRCMIPCDQKHAVCKP
jgi:hypothetical protein